MDIVYSAESVARYRDLLRRNRETRIDAVEHLHRTIQDAARWRAEADRAVTRASEMVDQCRESARLFALRTATYRVAPGTTCIDCADFPADLGMLCIGCHAEWRGSDIGND